MEHGPRNLKRHLATHHINGGKISYQTYEALKQAAASPIQFKTARYEKSEDTDKLSRQVRKLILSLTVDFSSLEDLEFRELILFTNMRYRTTTEDVIIQGKKKARDSSL